MNIKAETRNRLSQSQRTLKKSALVKKERNKQDSLLLPSKKSKKTKLPCSLSRNWAQEEEGEEERLCVWRFNEKDDNFSCRVLRKYVRKYIRLKITAKSLFEIREGKVLLLTWQNVSLLYLLHEERRKWKRCCLERKKETDE